MKRVWLDILGHKKLEHINILRALLYISYLEGWFSCLFPCCLPQPWGWQGLARRYQASLCVSQEMQMHNFKPPEICGMRFHLGSGTNHFLKKRSNTEPIASSGFYKYCVKIKQGHHQLSGKSDENKSFWPNQSAPSIYIMIELCYFSLDQWEIRIHLLWGKCFNIPHNCDPHLNQTKWLNS